MCGNENEKNDFDVKKWKERVWFELFLYLI
jgi:hypothetical protein